MRQSRYYSSHCSNLTLSCVLKGALRFSKTRSNILFVIITIFLLYIAVTPSAHLLCFCVFQVFFHSYVNKVSPWVPIFLVILSNYVHFNPGPHFQNNLFNLMTWNANSVAKDNFERVRLIQAHNSIFNYHIISICETSLNDSIELRTSHPANKPSCEQAILRTIHPANKPYCTKSFTTIEFPYYTNFTESHKTSTGLTPDKIEFKIKSKLRERKPYNK